MGTLTGGDEKKTAASLRAQSLLQLVYDELRRLAATKLAHEKPGQTLQTTALVHEAYLKLVVSGQRQEWECRTRFFAAAAEAMRRILIDKARRKQRRRHGGDSFDWFVLAMAHGKSGREDEAQKWYDRAVAWMGTNQPGNAELRRFHAEAADVLQVSAVAAGDQGDDRRQKSEN